MVWYEVLTVMVSILSLLGVGTIMQLFWKDRHEKRKQNSEEVKEQEKKERQEEIREVIKEEITPLRKEVKDIQQQLEINKEGTKAGLRNDLLNSYYSCSKKGYRTNEDIMNWEDMTEAYYNLGGNSFIVEIDKIINSIDSEEKYLAKKKQKAKDKKERDKKKKTLLNENK